MIPPVRDPCLDAGAARGAPANGASARRRIVDRRQGCGAFLIVVALTLATASTVAHDLEKTQITIAFAPDGSFVADVSNDPDWLKLRLESIPGPFADRVVLWVDGHEIRPSSVEFIAGSPAIHRLRGRVPVSAQTLRWFYGLVIDPYPLTIRRADGRLAVEEVQGDAWSRTIDLSGQFHRPAVDGRLTGVLVALFLLLPVALRFLSPVKDTKVTEAAKEQPPRP
jgi:hypothetical protein